jgi:hypothetical protein
VLPLAWIGVPAVRLLAVLTCFTEFRRTVGAVDALAKPYWAGPFIFAGLAFWCWVPPLL